MTPAGPLQPLVRRHMRSDSVTDFSLGTLERAQFACGPAKIPTPFVGLAKRAAAKLVSVSFPHRYLSPLHSPES